LIAKLDRHEGRDESSNDENAARPFGNVAEEVQRELVSATAYSGAIRPHPDKHGEIQDEIVEGILWLAHAPNIGGR